MEDKETQKDASQKVRLSMWLSKRQHDELKQLAEYEGRTVSDLIRQLVGSFLRDNNEKMFQRVCDANRGRE